MFAAILSMELNKQLVFLAPIRLKRSRAAPVPCSCGACWRSPTTRLSALHYSSALFILRKADEWKRTSVSPSSTDVPDRAGAMRTVQTERQSVAQGKGVAVREGPGESRIYK